MYNIYINKTVFALSYHGGVNSILTGFPMWGTNTIFNLGRSISFPLFKSIVDEANQQIEEEQIFPIELVMECMEYVGFIMHSAILNDAESFSFYRLLVEHHAKDKITSPLMDSKHIIFR